MGDFAPFVFMTFFLLGMRWAFTTTKIVKNIIILHWLQVTFLAHSLKCCIFASRKATVCYIMSLTTLLDDYISAHSSPEGDYLYRLFRATHVEILAPQMASGQVQGRLFGTLYGRGA